MTQILIPSLKHVTSPFTRFTETQENETRHRTKKNQIAKLPCVAPTRFIGSQPRKRPSVRVANRQQGASSLSRPSPPGLFPLVQQVQVLAIHIPFLLPCVDRISNSVSYHPSSSIVRGIHLVRTPIPDHGTYGHRS